jgi:feruloyl esterase
MASAQTVHLPDARDRGWTRAVAAAPVVAGLALLGSAPAHAATCESLSSLKLPNGAVTLAQPVAAGAFTPPAGGRGGRGGGTQFSDLPAFCRVAATLRPTSNSDIKIEVWLPASGWNGKFQAVGNGGWNGNIDTNALATGLRRGYATASTDTGHEGGGGPWMREPEKLVDYGHRAVHEMAVSGKAIVNAYYESAPKFSYFNGCSAGGRQGLKAAQTYPDDFDGIVAGAPALNATGRASFAMWVAQNLRKEEASFVPAEKYPAIHQAVLRACDAGDGVADGVIENPRACTFDPQVLACKAGDSPSCLTPPQVEAVRTMYEPLKHARTGEEIFPGLAYGSELGWGTFGGQQPFGIGAQMFQFMIFDDPKWDFRTLNFDAHMDLVRKVENGTVDAQDPDLRPFAKSGGKLLMYHGWSDPQIPAGSSVGYYERVMATMGGPASTQETARLFMVPGMNHCGGGPGTTTFDMLAALERWVEQGQAPARIEATRTADGKTERSRPLCAYPQVATYTGSGSTDEARNFVCK